MNEYYIVYDRETGAEAYRGEGPEGSAAIQVLTDGLRALVVPVDAWRSHPLDLAPIKAAYAGGIDLAAERERSAFITNTPGQMATYLEKEAEARRIVAGTSEPTPFLTAEAAALSISVPTLAAEIIGQADQWRPIGARIEAARRKAKVDLEQASNLAAIAQSAQVDWQAVVVGPASA